MSSISGLDWGWRSGSGFGWGSPLEQEELANPLEPPQEELASEGLELDVNGKPQLTQENFDRIKEQIRKLNLEMEEERNEAIKLLGKTFKDPTEIDILKVLDVRKVIETINQLVSDDGEEIGQGIGEMIKAWIVKESNVESNREVFKKVLSLLDQISNEATEQSILKEIISKMNLDNLKLFNQMREEREKE